MIELIKYLNSFQKLDAETEQAINKYFIKETFKKNEFIVKEGAVCTKVYFIESGLVRRFYIKDGREITRWIYDINHLMTMMNSYFLQQPTREYLQACENTVTYSISFSDEQKLLEYPLFAKCHIIQLRLYTATVSEFQKNYDLKTAQEKYSYILKYFPGMIQKAKLQHIASLINVSPETLSRIRASIT
ncbi:Crp/Fnr family transcriptional regulator [Saccharicrinis sp. FJH2]|uniref:Crp/Fnr family transcriptional regulator n=1 Tax=Saccharicrinis sp. FJH65 TaxID=3344659 RepID=UPI0035F4F550